MGFIGLRIYKIVLMWVVLIFGIAAQSNNSVAQDKYAAHKIMAENFLQDLYKIAAFLGPYMKPEERVFGSNMKFYVNYTALHEDIISTYDKKTNERRVSFSLTAVEHIAKISEAAMLMSTQIKDLKFLIGYLRYLSFRSEFDDDFKSPSEFAKFYGMNIIPPQSPDDKSRRDLLVAGTFSQIISFLLAHETAHHILGHIDDPQASLEERRRREIAADKWAVGLMLKAGSVPTGAVFLMLYYNEIHHRTLKEERRAKHPAPVKRAVALLENIIDALPGVRYKLRMQNAAAGIPYNHGKIVRVFTGVLDLLRAKRDLQIKTDQDPSYWLVLANQGDRYAQHKVASHFNQGIPPYPLDYAKSIKWFQKAATNPNKFDYVASVQADEAFGYVLAFEKNYTKRFGRHISLARKFFKRAASRGWLNSKQDIKFLDKLEE